MRAAAASYTRFLRAAVRSGPAASGVPERNGGVGSYSKPSWSDCATSGLASRAMLNSGGDNETGFLGTLDDIVASGKVPAERLLDLYHGEWNGDISRVYEESF